MENYLGKPWLQSLWMMEVISLNYIAEIFPFSFQFKYCVYSSLHLLMPSPHNFLSHLQTRAKFQSKNIPTAKYLAPSPHCPGGKCTHISRSFYSKNITFKVYSLFFPTHNYLFRTNDFIFGGGGNVCFGITILFFLWNLFKANLNF